MRERKARREQSGSLHRSRLRPHSLSARHRGGGATPGWFQRGTCSAWLGVAPDPSRHAARVARGDRGKARDAPPNRLGGLGCAQAAPRGAAGLAGGAPLGSRLGPHRLTCNSGHGTLRPEGRRRRALEAAAGCLLHALCHESLDGLRADLVASSCEAAVGDLNNKEGSVL